MVSKRFDWYSQLSASNQIATSCKLKILSHPTYPVSHFIQALHPVCKRDRCRIFFPLISNILTRYPTSNVQGYKRSVLLRFNNVSRQKNQRETSGRSPNFAHIFLYSDTTPFSWLLTHFLPFTASFPVPVSCKNLFKWETNIFSLNLSFWHKTSARSSTAV